LQKKAALSKETELLTSQLQSASFNDHPSLLSIDLLDNSGKTLTTKILPYLPDLEILRALIDEYEAAVSECRASIDGYTVLEQQVVAIVDWLAQRNRDRPLSLVSPPPHSSTFSFSPSFSSCFLPLIPFPSSSSYRYSSFVAYLIAALPLSELFI